MSDRNEYELPTGTILDGNFRIESKLRSGGFGITYKALDISLSRLVCVKELFILGHCIRGAGNTVQTQGLEALKFSDFRERFVKEAQRLAQFKNAGIVSVYRVFQENGTAYYCMEFIEGESLQQYIEREGKLSVDKSLAIMDKLLDAVEVLHNAKPPLLHRDIKPDNVMLRADGNPVLIDFGTAREYNNEVSRLQSRVYTPGYAPRELGSERDPDGPFTDVYSLGATLYKMLTGVTPLSFIDRGKHPLPSPAGLNPEVSDKLSGVIFKAMELDAENRYQSLGELREAMKLAEQDPDATQRIKQDTSEPNPSASESNEPKKTKPTKPKSFNKNGQKQVPDPPARKWLPLAAALGLLLVSAVIWLNRKGNSPSSKNTDSAQMTGVLADSTKRDSTTAVDTAYIPNPKPAPNNKIDPATTKTETSGKEKLQSVLQQLQNNMVYITGGTFTMGCTSEQGSDCYNDEKPAHQVTVSSFRMGKYEVTQAEWEAVMGSNPSSFKNCPNCPVENVSWNDVQNFLRRLNELTGGNYRLPTEAEWEYAARGGKGSNGYKHSGSDNIGAVAWYEDNSGNRTHPVGEKAANELGLYDMSGNVMEWCSDWYGYYSRGDQTNPKGPSTGSDRVFRGGEWDFDARHCRVSIRFGNHPEYRDYSSGFRLVSPSS